MKTNYIKKLSVIFAMLFCISANAEMNLTFNPLGLLIGNLNARLDIPINSNWVVGPELQFINLSLGDTTISATAVGANFGYYFNGNFQDSAYVTPAINYASFAVKNADDEVSASGASLSVVGGYHWFWEKFNIRLGGGASYFTGSATVSIEDEDGDEQDISLSAGFILDFALGFKF